MAGYVRHENAAWVELRVHGVSGTPPESMLGHPVVHRVAGDASSGFYRRVWPSRSVTADNPEHVLEAYSWGGLTSGGKLRVLWLLLIPFLLVNVAFYARPVDRPGRLQNFGEMIQRLYALAITATLVLATVNVSMDFAGWQCDRPTGNRCDTGWLDFLSWPWLDTTGRRIALTALLPIAVIVLLWRLAETTWCANEATPVDETQEPDHGSTPLENRHMWNSAQPVRRLRAVHITGALALVGIFALAPFARSWPALREGADHSWPITGTQVLLALMLLIALATIALACLPSMSDRPGAQSAKPQPHEREADERRSRLIGLLPWFTAALVTVSLAWIAFAVPRSAGLPDNPRTALPWLSGALHIGILAEAVLLVTMCAVLFSMRRSATPDDQTPPAWHGLGTVVLMLFGSAMAGMYAAALVLAVAHLLGKPKPSVQGADSLVTSLPFFWAAALAVAIAVTALFLGLWGWYKLSHSATRDQLEVVDEVYAQDRSGQDSDERAQQIARTWATATLDSTFRIVAGWFVAVTVVLVLAVGVAYWIDASLVDVGGILRLLANLGDALIAFWALALLYLGRKAYQNAGTRRIVGVIWDLGTFWPRAAHPLAPPCYAERAVPELLNRVEYLGREDRVILSCHSQGCVIGTAVVNQLNLDQAERVALLTYGAPLRRLYARFFPAYFGRHVLENTEAFLLGSRERPDRADVPWRNLYRRSDPIGGAVFGRGAIDQMLVDPQFDRADGDISYPQTYGHSGYPDDPAWPDAVTEVKRLRLAAPGSLPTARHPSAQELGGENGRRGTPLQDPAEVITAEPG